MEMEWAGGHKERERNKLPNWTEGRGKLGHFRGEKCLSVSSISSIPPHPLHSIKISSARPVPNQLSALSKGGFSPSLSHGAFGLFASLFSPAIKSLAWLGRIWEDLLNCLIRRYR